MKPPAHAPAALWSAATCRRFFRWADLSAKQRRGERREQSPEPTACHQIVPLIACDSDKSRHSKGFALNLTAPLFKQVLCLDIAHLLGGAVSSGASKTQAGVIRY